MGAEYSVVGADQGERGRSWSTVSRILYRLIAALALWVPNIVSWLVRRGLFVFVDEAIAAGRSDESNG